MKLAVPKERRAGEKRVAATPDTVKKFAGLGFEVVVEAGAGLDSGIADAQFAAAGAKIAADAAAVYAGATLVLKVQRPVEASDKKANGGIDELALIPAGAALVAVLQPFQFPDSAKAYAAKKIDAFAMEWMPRITRAQSMDVLSSQSNLSGYRAVIDAASEFSRAFPMMMTAAGTVPPARVLVLGAGVAGLQAIATAKRLGAVVSAFDVRPAVKEQVQSLGASFVEVDPAATADAETKGGYAKEMSDEYKKKQADKIHETLKKSDIAISTALIPGKPAPILITAAMVKDMKPGSVIIDLAVEAGGNCELAKPGETVVVGGVKIVGHLNLPSRTATDSSALYAKNLLNFLTPQIDNGTKALKFNWEDETVKGTGLTREGAVVHPNLAGKPA